MERCQKAAILADLQKKMVLLARPRQAGKTTLAKEIGNEFDSTIYLNCDSTGDRKIIDE
ncbi:MAG: AAA family ATPase [Waddliaceae bacterium]